MNSEFESTSDRFGKGIIAIAMGIGLIFVALKFGHYVSKNYIETPCVLKHVSFGINSKSYDMATEFDYEFKGKTYTSEKFSDQKTFSDSSDVRRASEVERAFDADKKIICYVLEDDPSEAYLVEPTFGFYLKWGVFACGVFILLTGLGYIAQVLTDNFVPGARAYLGLFFSASMLMVAVIGSYFIYPCLSQVLDSGNWKNADAVVDHRFYDVSVNDEGEKSFNVEILYRYKYKGKEYRSIQYNFLNSSSSDKEEAIAIGKKYPQGTKFQCYVDPDNPKYSVIEKEAFVVYLLAFAVIVFYLVAYLSINGWGIRIRIK
ncbi:MAG: DUF3592 domain-containing protein [Lentisphaeraceae bacterium]|nr:DUF3592 domain-containing protein [Lentisphaeraceae bacterium]